MKKFYTLFVLALLALTAQAQSDLTWWGYYANEGFAITGNNKVPGTYEAAMFVAGDADLKGISIEQIRIQTRLSASSSENVKFWIRTALDGENVVEVAPESVSSSGYTTVTLPEAYALPETGAYVGYTFTVTQWWNEYEGTPVVYAKKYVANSFFLKQPGETEFADKGGSTGCLAAQIAFTAPQTTMWWGNYTGSETVRLTGNSKLGKYEAAMFVAGDGALAGSTIKTMRAQTRLYSNAKDFKFWIRTALDGENVAEAVPETVSGSGLTTAEFSTPYDIPETGCYVGYSFNLASWYSDYDYTPICYIEKKAEKGFYLMQPDETAFADLSATKGSLAAQIEVSGASIPANSVQVADDIDDMVALVGQPIALTLNLTSQGTAGVKSIDYAYTINGATKEGHADLATPIDAMLGAKGKVAIELEAPTAAGQQEIEIQITKVNGEANATTGKKSKCSVIVTVLTESAPRKAVAEIFYNATNGYAPRAIVGQQLLQENDNIISFLIDHYSGKQAVASYADFQKIPDATSFTNKYGAYPIAEVNRTFTEDPYTGMTKAANSGVENHFAAAEPILATLNEVTEGTVAVEAEWNDAMDKVSLKATASFMADFSDAPYRLAFVIIEDNVKETISNYITYYKPAYADDDMEEWRTNPYNNTDYALNNVAVAATEVTGIVSSLPKKLTAGQEYEYETEIEVPEHEGQEEATNARAIVLLINKDTKQIVNANIAVVSGGTVGITTVSGEEQQNAPVYTLSGQQVKNLTKGLYIQGGRKFVVK